MSLSTQLFWVQTPAEGRLAVAARPRGGDWLNDEIAGWHDAGIGRVVSLLTPVPPKPPTSISRPEVSLFDQHAVEFTNLPVEDRSIPSSDREALALARSIAADLTRGRNVVVHCRQGVGQAPLIAVCALLELGKGAYPGNQSCIRCPGLPYRKPKRRWTGSAELRRFQLAAPKVH